MTMTQTRRGRRGHIAIFVALSLVAIVGTLALSLDGGAIMSERRHGQATADAAALAGASQLYYLYWSNNGYDSDGTAKAAALTAASKNGYTNNTTDSVVTINIPPTSGQYVGKAGYCEAIVQYNQPRGFSNLFGSGTIPVKARAVAVGMPMAADGGIIVLDPSSKSAFNAGGGGTLTILNTPVIVNSASSEGSIANGGTIITAPNFNLAGNYTTSGGGQFVGNVNLNVPPYEDPLKYLPVPDPSKMTKQSNKKTQETSGNITLQPGVYKGGISVSGTASLTLQPGIYYMDGGGFSFSGQGNLTGNGVMIYNAPGNGNSDGVSVSGQGVINISAPTSGVYQGVTFFQDRNSTVTGNISGSGNSSMTGTFYFAGALLNVSGNGTNLNMGSQYISYDLNIQGNGSMIIEWKPELVGRRRMIALVE